MTHRTKTLLGLLSFAFANPVLAYRLTLKPKENQNAAQDNAALVDVTQQVQQLTTTSNSPVVYNKCNMPLAVYLARGFLFNKQVIWPGEAAQLYSPDTGPFVAPYHIVAIVGDENALPGDLESLLHFIGKAAVPAAFVGGVAISIASWGALTGPALALGPLVSNAPMIMGYTLGAVDIAAGAAAVKIAENVTESEYYTNAARYIVGNHSKAFMAKSSWVLAGESYFEVVGGPDEATATPEDLVDLQINKIDARTYNNYQVETVKLCQALSTRGSSGSHAFTISGCGNPAVNGRWRMGPDHNDRPSYFRYDEEDLVIEWSSKRSKWRITTITKPMGGIFRSRTTFYESDAHMSTIPDYGWSTVSGSGEAPTVALSVAFTIKNAGDPRLNGDWAVEGEHNDRLQYSLINGDEDDEIVIEYSWKRGIWRATTTWGWWRSTLYSSSSTATFAEGGETSVPASGWTVVDGTAPAPEFVMP